MSRILLWSFALPIRRQPVNGTEKGAAGSSRLMGKGWPQLAVMSGSQPAGQAPRDGDGYRNGPWAVRLRLEYELLHSPNSYSVATVCVQYTPGDKETECLSSCLQEKDT